MKEYNIETGTEIAELRNASISEFAELALSSIVASQTNPRTTFHQGKLLELAESIRASDVHQPILVRPLPANRTNIALKVQYEIVAGERRFRASGMAGKSTIPAMIRQMDDATVLEVQIVENLQRDDLSELEEAEGYERLMAHSKLTADAVGGKIGKSRSYVYGRLKLLDLCQEARTKLRDGIIDASKALMLARLPDHKLQIKAMEEVVLFENHRGEQCYGVREVSRLIQSRYMLPLDKATFPITDSTLVPGATACGACPKRTGHEPELFSDVDSPDVCTDPECYRSKEAAHQARELQAAHERGQTVITGREAKALWPNGWGSVEGYLRLDDTRDSPTPGKPLRKLLSKALEEGIKPVLIDNPHKPGELVAMLPAATVAELLGQQGDGDDQAASKKITQNLKDDEKIKKTREATALKNEFEQGWRNELLKRTFEKLSGTSRFSRDRGLSLNVARHIALDFANRLNTEKAKFLCGLLELGKVAPVQALIDHITDHPEPEQMILLLVMHRDVEYQSWRHDGGTNPGLMLVADDFQVDVEAVKADVKKGVKAKLKAEKKLPETPISQGSHPKGGAGAKASTDRPAAAPRKPKLSAAEATQGIAAAMQQMGGGHSAAAGSCLHDDHASAAPAPQDDGQTAPKEAGKPGRIAGTLKLPSRAAKSPAAAAQGTLPVGVAIGQQVMVLDNVKPIQQKFAGMRGEVLKKVGDRAWIVKLKGGKAKPGGQVVFDATELEVLA